MRVVLVVAFLNRALQNALVVLKILFTVNVPGNGSEKFPASRNDSAKQSATTKRA